LKLSLAFKLWQPLLLAVSLNVMLGSVLGVFGGMNVVAMSQVRMVGSCLVVAVEMMPGGFVVVACTVFMVFRCLGVMMCGFV
jgi:hypothetical protein